MQHKSLWIIIIGILVLISGSLIYQTATGQSGSSDIIVSDADAISEAIKLTNQILQRPANGASELISVRGAAHIQTYDFQQPFVEATPIPTPTATALPTATPIPPTATSMPTATATDSEPESNEVDEVTTVTDMPNSTAIPVAIEAIPTRKPIPKAVGQVEKYACRKAWGYGSESELKNQLLTSAKRAAVNELFGEQITSVTNLENFKLTKDIITALSAGSVRVSGTPDYYNGDDFAQACVSIVAYVTEEDRAAFAPKSVSSGKVCRANDSTAGGTLRSQAREAAILDAVLSYDGKLAPLDPSDVRGLLRGREFASDSGFDPQTGAYCTRVTGEVWPIEVMALLGSE